MKRVVSSEMVAHLWAHQSQDDARNAGSSMYFNGDTVYSYGNHFPMARHIESATGEPGVLVNVRSYSVTTSKHQGHVVRAIQDNRRQFGVTDPSCQNPSALLQDYAKRISDNLHRASKMRRCAKRSTLIESALEMRGEALSLARFLAVSEERALSILPALDPNSDLVTQARTFTEAREQEISRERAEREERYARERAELAAKAIEKLSEWREGGQGSSYLQYLEHPALRLVGDVVQTTLGAEIPAEHARKLWPVWRRCVDRGEGYKRNGHTVHVGPFAVDEITADGDLHAGCHYIQRAELERMEHTLGLSH